jgi:hypothetical protein
MGKEAKISTFLKTGVLAIQWLQVAENATFAGHFGIVFGQPVIRSKPAPALSA